VKPPPFIGIFESRFPAWGGNEPHKHGEDDCTMYQSSALGYCISNRFIPQGVAGIDRDGQCWVLVDDYSIKAVKTPMERLRWMVFPVEVAE
jgi:hypothetical protein